MYPCSQIFLILFSLLVFNVSAQNTAYSLNEEKSLFEPVADVSIIDGSSEILLSKIYAKQPIVLALVFTRCSGICNPLLNNLKINREKSGYKDDYKVVVMSFDPADTPQDMNELSELYSLEKDMNWVFAVTPHIDSLTASLAFKPIWDEEKQQFDHDALLVGINSDGVIVRKLIGIRDVHAFKSLLDDIMGVYNPSHPIPGENGQLSCFAYNEDTGDVIFGIGFFILAFPTLFTFGLVAGVSFMVKRND